MSGKKKEGKPLITDNGTDYLFDYFMNEDKFNEQMREKWDEDIQKKFENHRQPKLDSRIVSDKNALLSSTEEKELPSTDDVEFNDESESDSTSDNQSASESGNRTPYDKKIDAVPYTKSVKKPNTEFKAKTEINNSKKIHTEPSNKKTFSERSRSKISTDSRPKRSEYASRPLLGDKLIEDEVQRDISLNVFLFDGSVCIFLELLISVFGFEIGRLGFFNNLVYGTASIFLSYGVCIT